MPCGFFRWFHRFSTRSAIFIMMVPPFYKDTQRVFCRWFHLFSMRSANIMVPPLSSWYTMRLCDGSSNFHQHPPIFIMVPPFLPPYAMSILKLVPPFFMRSTTWSWFHLFYEIIHFHHGSTLLAKIHNEYFCDVVPPFFWLDQLILSWFPFLSRYAMYILSWFHLFWQDQ